DAGANDDGIERMLSGTCTLDSGHGKRVCEGVNEEVAGSRTGRNHSTTNRRFRRWPQISNQQSSSSRGLAAVSQGSTGTRARGMPIPRGGRVVRRRLKSCLGGCERERVV